MFHSFLQLIILCVCQLPNYNHDKHKIMEVHVEPYKGLSYGAFFKSLTLKTQPEDIEYIEGFEFEWAHSYQLKVEQTKLEHPPQDGSDTQYKLIKVISKTKVNKDFTFKLRLESEVYLGGDHGNSFKQINDSTYIYFDEITLIVPSKHQYQMQDLVNSTDRKTAVFSFIDSTSIRLINFE